VFTSIIRAMLVPVLTIALGNGLHASVETPVERVTKQFDDLITVLRVRYMEQHCEPVGSGAHDWDPDHNWDSFSSDIIRCTYTRKGKHDKQTKQGEVVMLNAKPEQLARWVVSACVAVTGKADASCTDFLLNQINGASNAQFVIAGLVLEDQLPVVKLPSGKKKSGNGKYEIYSFRDGVTVKVDDIQDGDEATIPDDSMRRIALTGVPHTGWTGLYGRIISTTREQYKANGGKISVGSSEKGKRNILFLKAIREEYQKAWGNDRNELIIAFARANKDSL